VVRGGVYGPLVLRFALAVALFGVIVAPAAALDDFASPSGNISCLMDATSVRCDIARSDWRIVKRPKGCQGDFGQGLEVGRRSKRGEVVCAGDSALGARRILVYGRSITAGSLRCTSRSTGMTCRNGLGHGFILSRESFWLF
jgi:uncharacterized protein DUF6636